MPGAEGGTVLDRREDPERPELLLRCGASGPEIWLPGRHLLAVFELDAEWLVFTDHDIPEEELLEICLVSEGRIADRASLAFPGWTSAGIDPVREGGPRFGFDFPPGRRWRLEIGARPTLIRRRLGVHRDGRWWSRLWLAQVARDAESP